MSFAEAMPFDRRRLLPLADWLAVGVAVSLPWSTSATSILIALWLVAVLAGAEHWRDLARNRKSGRIFSNLALAARGTRDAVGRRHMGRAISAVLMGLTGSSPFRCCWRNSVARSVALSCSMDFLFQRCVFLRHRGSQYSFPRLEFTANSTACRSRTTSFRAMSFCSVPSRSWELPAILGVRKKGIALTLCALAVVFLVNILFVITSRTNLGVLLFLILALGWWLANLKGVVLAFLIAAILAPVLWFSSPHLRDFAGHGVEELRDYFTRNEVTSAGEHVEFLRQSVAIVEKAPVFGHGTGSIAEQFQHVAAGETGAAAVATVNPHNQIFAVAIQLGAVGAAVLIAMWVAHFALFRGSGWAAWIGMVIVLQNVVSSLAHSHLFDFTQGWLYVFGVGVTGGMALRKSDAVSMDADTGRRPYGGMKSDGTGS